MFVDFDKFSWANNSAKYIADWTHHGVVFIFIQHVISLNELEVKSDYDVLFA